MSFLRSSGVLLHPVSFPSNYGIGDFGESGYKFIDFLEKSGQTLWQVLPLGPTSFGDSPYQSFSTFAGNILLISPDILIKKGLLDESIKNEIPQFSNNKIDYGNVIKYKTGLYKKAFEKFKKTKNKAFDEFCEKNKNWLEDYALFVSLKDYFIEERKNEWESAEFKKFCKKTKGKLSENVQKDYYYGAVWSTWPISLVKREAATIKKWQSKLADSILYYKFLQFEFFEEWFELKKYANSKDIKIIGDIPIFVAYDSADAWANPKNYYMDTEGFPTLVAGVPPDYFSATGQLWGNPLYKWSEHKNSKYKWWIDRIKSILSMVDIVRIDHFRGFESFWQVPFGEETAINGKWTKGPGAELFNAIKKELGSLPIIAEDLGIITDEVNELRDKLQFPGMKVLQFAFDDSENNDYLPHNYDKNCVVYTGTHDNDTTLGWYRNANENEKDKLRRYMNVSGENVSWDLIRLAMSSTAVFSIFPLQDIMKLDESARMNTPSVAGGNWQWRYTDDMLKDEYSESLMYLTKLFARKTVIKKDK